MGVELDFGNHTYGTKRCIWRSGAYHHYLSSYLDYTVAFPGGATTINTKLQYHSFITLLRLSELPTRSQNLQPVLQGPFFPSFNNSVRTLDEPSSVPTDTSSYLSSSTLGTISHR